MDRVEWVLYLCVLLLRTVLFAAADSFSQVLYGEVGAGNYSYYSLTRQGRVTLLLDSAEGDADLYCSSANKKPTYALDKHEWQSTTCGQDVVHIDSLAKRPVAIGVYGYPTYELSRYQLTVILNEDEELRAEDGEETEHEATNEPEFEVGSLLEVLGSVLKFVLEILVDILV